MCCDVEGGLPDKTAELQGFLERFMCRNSGSPTVPNTNNKSNLDEDNIITKATYARNGTTFKKLWSGDCSGYASQSEADLALAGILAFWTGKDLSQMDRLFRRSGLFREKWDRKQSGSTYGHITLKKAIGETRDVYHSPKKNAVPTGDGKPDLHKLKPEDNDRYCWADIGSGRLFGDYFKDVARFVPERKLWYCFDGKRWIPDLSVLGVMELRPHNSADKITKLSPVKYESAAHFKRWDNFISEITSGDIEKAKFLQKAMGYASVEIPSMNVCLFCTDIRPETVKALFVKAFFMLWVTMGGLFAPKPLHSSTKTIATTHQRMWQDLRGFALLISANLAVDLYSMLPR